jgi:xanthine/uracil permease
MSNNWQAPLNPQPEGFPQDEGDNEIEWDMWAWILVTLVLFIYASFAGRPLMALLAVPVGILAGLLVSMLREALRND